LGAGHRSVAQFIFTLAFPSLYIETGQHENLAESNNKNGLVVLSLSALNFLLLALDSRRYRYIVWGGFGLSVILLLLQLQKNCLSHFLDTAPSYHYLELCDGTTVGCALYITVLLVGGGVAIWLVGIQKPLLQML